MDSLRSTLRINILIPEYPGYGTYTKHLKPTSRRFSSILSEDTTLRKVYPSAE